VAARAEGKCVDSQLLRTGIEFWLDSSDVVIIEGAGGLMSPVSDDDYNADLAAHFGFPLVVVAENVLGTINATLQTLIAARSWAHEARSKSSRSLSVAGVVLNSPRSAVEDPSIESNASELARRCATPLLATVEFGGGFDRAVDWWSLAGPAGTNASNI
jgi:dethiobiotin synthetase